ncbi:MAG: hypothetical protein U9R54_06210 [Bacteroidota bacterium]|nr:hypothetical protein [Bacteroidota bacterium]
MKQKENSEWLEKLHFSDTKIWKFETENHYMQFIRHGDYLEKFKTKPLSTSLIKGILAHKKRNEFLNQLDLNWVHENFIYPELIIDKNNFNDIVNKDISKPLDLVYNFLKKANLHSFITSKQFYEKISCNKQIDTSNKLIDVCKIIMVAQDINVVLNNIDIYITKLISDNKYKKIFNSYFNSGIKLNMLWNTQQLKDNWSNIEISYKGIPEIPDNYKLITKWDDILGMNECKAEDCWISLLEKKIFVISLKTQEYTYFEIRNEDYIFNLCPIEKDSIKSTIKNTWQIVIKEENQKFFQTNYIQKTSNETAIEKLEELFVIQIADILDSI